MTDLRKERTNLLILNSFNQLLTEKPFTKITVAEIVKRAMIHRNTFYQHFEDKYDLLKKYIERMVNEFDFTKANFKEKPFFAIHQLFLENHLAVVNRQETDTNFRETVSHAFLNSIIKKAQTEDIFWIIGKVVAIFVWNESNGNPYDLLHDYQKLDQFFQKDTFNV